MVFECNSLKAVTSPSTVNKMGRKAFYWCANLAKVTFEAGRTENLSIDSSIFESNSKLTEVTIVNKIPLYGSAFDGTVVKKIVIDTEANNVQFNKYCFVYDHVSKDLRIYVRNDAMKEKITKNKFLYVKPENVIVGLPNENA